MSCSTTQLVEMGRDLVSITVAMITDYCVMGSRAEWMQLPFNNFCVLLSTFFINAHLLRTADIGYFALHFLSA